MAITFLKKIPCFPNRLKIAMVTDVIEIKRVFLCKYVKLVIDAKVQKDI